MYVLQWLELESLYSNFKLSKFLVFVFFNSSQIVMRDLPGSTSPIYIYMYEYET